MSPTVVSMVAANGTQPSGTRALNGPRPVDWSRFWSDEANRRTSNMLGTLMERFTGLQGVVALHGGLPPPEAFPVAALALTERYASLITFLRLCIEFRWFPAVGGGSVCTAHHGRRHQACHARLATSFARRPRCRLHDTFHLAYPASLRRPGLEPQGPLPAKLSGFAIDVPTTVALAQQYNLQPRGYPPLVAWASSLVARFHAPPCPVRYDMLQQRPMASLPPIPAGYTCCSNEPAAP